MLIGKVTQGFTGTKKEALGWQRAGPGICLCLVTPGRPQSAPEQGLPFRIRVRIQVGLQPQASATNSVGMKPWQGHAETHRPCDTEEVSHWTSQSSATRCSFHSLYLPTQKGSAVPVKHLSRSCKGQKNHFLYPGLAKFAPQFSKSAQKSAFSTIPNSAWPRPQA